MPKRIKVMYLITKNTQGRGGHYYSLKTTTEALKEIVKPIVVTVSKVEVSTKNTDQLIYCNGWNILSVLYRLLKIVRKEKPDVLHAFDGSVLLFARIMSHIYKIPLMYTKCGGANPSGFYPYVKEIIVYSHENLRFFEAESKLRNTNLYFIPNRVMPIKSDEKRISAIQKQLDGKKKVLLRIARFGPAYKESILQSIDLLEFLSAQKISAQLVLIGIIQDKKVYDDIMNYINERRYLEIYVFNDDIFTTNASELIELSDCVIGTGRSLMEAASKHKVLFTPVESSPLPVLVTKENFEDFFITNFSPRNQCNQKQIDQNKTNIVTLFGSSAFFREQEELAKSVYERYFNINTKKEEYNKIYSSVTYKKEEYFLNLAEHFIRTCVSFAKRV